MPRWRRIVRTAAIASALVAYPILAHFMAAAPPPAGIGAVAFAVAPLLIVLAIMSWQGGYRGLTAGLCVAASALLWLYADALGRHLPVVYLLQHLSTNAALALLFGRSLLGGREPLCSRFAALARGPLPPPVARYTRHVTLAWTLFFVATIAASALLFAFASIGAWSVFANLLALPLAAALFIAEYAVRQVVLPDLPRTSILDSWHAYWQTAGVPAPASESPRWRRQ